MDSQTSKAQLRARIRSARAHPTRTADPHDPAPPAPLAEAPPVPLAEAAPDSASPVPTSTSSVSDVAWNIIGNTSVHALLAYAALPGEPNLDPALDRFLASGGTVYLPVVTKVGEPLRFAEVTGSMASLEPQSKWGIREPSDDASLLTPAQLLSTEVGLDLIFVPALGFGTGGARLGNGGGFYDRTFGPRGAQPLGAGPRGAQPLSASPRVYGVCFAAELELPGLVAEDWDLRIPAAVTEDGIHCFTQTSQ